MSDGDDIRPLSHPERLEIFLRLQTLERATDKTTVQVEERGKATDHRLSALEDVVQQSRAQSKQEHDAVEAKMEALDSKVDAKFTDLAKTVKAGQLTPASIMLAVSPLAVAIIGLIAVLLTGNGP